MYNIEKPNLKKLNFSQVKSDEISRFSIEGLQKAYRIEHFLKLSKIVRVRGLHTFHIFHIFFLLIFQRTRSVYEGLKHLDHVSYKTTINNFLNHPFYDWRKLQLSVAKHFIKKHPPDMDKTNTLIIDDTAKRKTGKRIEYLGWFYDHCNASYFKGFQVLFVAWSNSRTCIPIDFVLKIGKSRCKGSKRGDYAPSSHTFQRIRESLQTK